MLPPLFDGDSSSWQPFSTLLAIQQQEAFRWYVFCSSVSIFVSTAAGIVAGALLQIVVDRSTTIRDLPSPVLLIVCVLLMGVAAASLMHHYQFKSKLRYPIKRA
jgi:F0F1-type ATP synthase assembly protein I